MLTILRERELQRRPAGSEEEAEVSDGEHEAPATGRDTRTKRSGEVVSTKMAKTIVVRGQRGAFRIRSISAS